MQTNAETCGLMQHGTRDPNRRQFLRQSIASAATICVAWPGSDEQKSQLRIAWIDDQQRRTSANRAGRNYWNAYIPEILSELGMHADALPPTVLGNEKQLRDYSTLLIADLDVEKISLRAAGALEKWMRGGGVLIAFGTQGLDGLCGNRSLDRMEQPGDEFTCAATFALGSHALTTGIHSYLKPEQRLLIFSPVRKVRAEQSVEIGRLYDLEDRDTDCAAVTARELGSGRIFYFGFSVPQTMWVLHQGRPVDRDYDGDGWLRRSDAIVRRPHAPEVAYADELSFLLQNMIGTQPHAYLHQLPPMRAGAETTIPDALFFWGGDDEGDLAGIQITSSNWMKEKGLPYHINVMPRKDGTFGLSPEDAKKILANGHELAVHFNFIDNSEKGKGFTREEILSQAAAFRQRFNIEQTCSVNHWNRWTGWAEPAKWMSEAGVKADNSSPAVGSPPSNNVNTLGFSFGTAFPYWFYDDWRGGNARIDFLEEPICAYECGYRGEDTDFAMVRKAVDIAAHYHLTMNMFYHPIYIAKYPACRAAIEETLRYIKERKINAIQMGPDALYRWWKARSETQLGAVTVAGNELSVEVESSYPEGVIVKIPLGVRTAKSVRTNGEAAKTFKNEQMFGQNWALIAVPSGKNRLQVSVS